ncbi:MAG: hypothetical protein JWR84_4004 [Caulobacter sp.]|nr:hypothetical protein [Caulobacter sp.]
MRDIIEGPPGEDDAPLPWRIRLMWFAGLAVAGSAATAVVAYALRALLKL